MMKEIQIIAQAYRLGRERQHLQRAEAPQPLVADAVDARHATLTEQSVDLVPLDDGAGLEVGGGHSTSPGGPVIRLTCGSRRHSYG